MLVFVVFLLLFAPFVFCDSSRARLNGLAVTTAAWPTFRFGRVFFCSGRRSVNSGCEDIIERRRQNVFLAGTGRVCCNVVDGWRRCSYRVVRITDQLKWWQDGRWQSSPASWKQNITCENCSPCNLRYLSISVCLSPSLMCATLVADESTTLNLQQKSRHESERLPERA